MEGEPLLIEQLNTLIRQNDENESGIAPLASFYLRTIRGERRKGNPERATQFAEDLVNRYFDQRPSQDP